MPLPRAGSAAGGPLARRARRRRQRAAAPRAAADERRRCDCKYDRRAFDVVAQAYKDTTPMPSRRTFIWSSAATMILSRAPRIFAQRGRGGPELTNIPPSIAALTSMADQVRPITNDERKAR